MGDRNPTLEYFLETYLAVVTNADIDDALRDFARSEAPNKVVNLRRELERAIVSDTSQESLDNLTSLISLLGNYTLPNNMSPIKFLNEMYERSQLVGPSEPYTKPIDVFVSFAKHDTAAAKRIAAELVMTGFKVWYDEWDLLSAGNLALQLSHGLRSSDCIVVILSKETLKSEWVIHELRTAIVNGEKNGVVVIPVIMGDLQLPVELPTPFVLRLISNWEESLGMLRRILESLRSRQQLGRHMPLAPSAVGVGGLQRFCVQARNEMTEHGWEDTKPYKEVAIGPLDDAHITIPKPDLAQIIKSCRVNLKNWGGAPFPYDEFPGSRVSRMVDGLSLVDKTPWPFSSWSFNYWRFSEQGYFVQRSDLNEDQRVDIAGRVASTRVLAIELALADLCTPLVFAHRLAIKLQHPGDLIVRYRWAGMKDRRLVVLDPRKVPMLHSYQSSSDEFAQEAVVRRDIDLFPIAESLVSNLYWQFGWERYSKEQTSDDIRQVLNGLFPR